MLEAMNSKRGDEYYTPEWVYKPLGKFDADYCAGPGTCVADRNYTKESDGLSMDWEGFVWCNPPFSDKLPWIERMKAHGSGILLLPSSPSTPWFADLVTFCGYAFFIGRKVSFVNGSSSNFGGTCLFPFGEEALRRLRETTLEGFLMKTEGYTPRKPLVKATNQMSLF